MQARYAIYPKIKALAQREKAEIKPREISEIITHLAFYSGWGNAVSATAVAKDVFAERKIGADQLPPASPALLPLRCSQPRKLAPK